MKKPLVIKVPVIKYIDTIENGIMIRKILTEEVEFNKPEPDENKHMWT